MDKPISKIVVILGTHRSGTSVLSRALLTLGVNLGTNLMPPGVDNVKGFWEDIDFVTLNEEMLTCLGSSWQAVTPLSSEDVSFLKKRGFFEKALTLVNKRLRKWKIFGIKDPRMCHLIPFWMDVLSAIQAEVYFLHVFRNPISVAYSLNYRNNIEIDRGGILWFENCFSSIRATEGQNRIFVDYDSMIAEPNKEIKRIATEFKLVVDPKEFDSFITQFLDSSLRHSVESKELIPKFHYPKLVYTLYNELLKISQNKCDPIDFNLKMHQWDKWILDNHHFLMLIDKLQQDKNKLQHDKDNLQQVRDKLQQDKNKLQHDKDNLQQVRDKLQHDRDNLQHDRDKLQHDKDKLQQARDNLQQVRDRLQHDKDNLQRDKDEITRKLSLENENLFQQIKAQREEYQNYNDMARLLEGKIINRYSEELKKYEGDFAKSLEEQKVLLEFLSLNVFTKIGIRISSISFPRKWKNFLLLSRVLKKNPLFDAQWYLERYPDVKEFKNNLLYHYVFYGMEEGRNPNPFFDGNWYLDFNLDVKKEKINPLLHYITRGSTEKRSPNPYFDVHWYIEQYLDNEYQGNILLHFIESFVDGILLQPNPYFDTKWYVTEYNRYLSEEKYHPLKHYIENFRKEYVKPNLYFDKYWYSFSYPKIESDKTDLFLHYLTQGKEEGVEFSPFFDSKWYRQQYAGEVGGQEPFFHYINEGFNNKCSPSLYIDAEWYCYQYKVPKGNDILADFIKNECKHQPNPFFDPVWYLQQNPDVEACGFPPLKHYIMYGWREGRSPNPFFEQQWYMQQWPESAANSTPLLHYLQNGREQGKCCFPRPNIPAYLLPRDGLCDSHIFLLNEKRSVKKKTLLDVILVTFNSAKWIEKCLKGLLPFQDFLNVIVVDNASGDNSLELLSKHKFGFKNLKIIKNEKNMGFGYANNQAALVAQNDFVFFLNIDTELTDIEWYDKLNRVILQSPSDVAAWELRQLPYEHPKCYDPTTLETSWVSGAAVVFRKSYFEAVKGFDEKLFMYCEDVDLSWRVRAKGGRLMYCPHISVVHHCYKYPGEEKRLARYYGLKHNYFLRKRFGNQHEQFLGEDLLSRLNCLVQDGFEEIGCPKIEDIKSEGKYFADTKIASNSCFEASFYQYDYELVREGAFYSCCREFKSTPKVSVIVRTIGRLEYLRKALCSIVNQTYKNIEIIVVEDGSNHFGKIADEFIDFDIKYIPIEKSGRCVAGNVGLDNSSGEYLNFLDEDDLFYCDHIETLLSEMLKDEQLSVVWSSAFCVMTDKQDSKRYREKQYVLFGREEPDINALLRENFFPIQSVLFKRQCYENLGGFDLNITLLEDWDLWIRYFKKYKFKRVEKTTSLYRVPSEPIIRERREREMGNFRLLVQRKNYRV